MQSLIHVSDVSFELPNGRTLFHNINFTLNPQLTALVGPNGVGKTTLAKIIAGIVDPTHGHVNSHAPIVLLSQREKAEDIPVFEYLSTHYSWSLLGENLLEGIDRESLCSTLSGGQWMRVRLASSIDNQFLILDEPTNDLDREARRFILSFLREYPYGALIISHDRECLGLCEEVLELSNRGLSKYGGGWELYEETKSRERGSLEANLQLAKRERDESLAHRLEMLEKQDKRNRRGKEQAKKGGIPKILLGGRKRRAQVTSGKVDSETLGKLNQEIQSVYEAYNEIKIDPVIYADLVGKEIPNQKLVAEASDFNIRYVSWVYHSDLNFSWKGNIRLAIKGGNGSGKSTLIKAILGQDFETRGELKRGELRTLYVDQACSVLDESKSVFENVRRVSEMDDKEIRNGLAKLLFFGDSVFQEVRSLSGGERLRAALACGLLSTDKPELLILDEPTNNLDLGNINFLEKLLSEFKGALILISHDDIFLDECGVKEEIVL